MKRWIVILLTAMAVMLTVDLCAQDRQRGVEISGGTDLVSGYVWRGVWEAGVSLQPTLALAAGNFSVTAWGSVDFDDGLCPRPRDFLAGRPLLGRRRR